MCRIATSSYIMASDKDKRFRVHVVKELYETERDYTQQLEFTVTVSGHRADFVNWLAYISQLCA